MSATYQVTSLTTLETSTVSLDQLSRNLKLNSMVSRDGRPIGLVTHWDLVFFARTWAGWALEDCGERPPEEVLVALSLVDQWLQDQGSVSGEELKAAAVEVVVAAARVAEAAGAAARTAEAARAAEAAEAARAAAEAARSAAWAAAEAAAEAAGAAARVAAWAAAEAAEAARAAARVAARVAEAARAAARVAARVAAQAADRADLAAMDAAFQRQGRFIIEHLKNSSQTSFPSSAA